MFFSSAEKEKLREIPFRWKPSRIVVY